MGKKSSRASKTSAGARRSISKSNVRLGRERVSAAEKIMNEVNAWIAGKNPWITVPSTANPGTFVKKRANEVYGDPKRRTYNIYMGKGE